MKARRKDSGNCLCQLHWSLYLLFLLAGLLVATEPLSAQDLWIHRTSGTLADLHTVTVGDHGFVAGGESGVLLYSSNGMDWLTCSNPSPHTGFRNVQDLCFGNGKYVGALEAYGIIQSYDGTNWTFVELTNSGTAADASITWATNQFVEVKHYNGIYRSDDALIWHLTNTTDYPLVNGLEYGRGTIVGSGQTDGMDITNQTVMWSSTDGSTWSSNIFNIPYEYGEYYDLCFYDNLFISAGFLWDQPWERWTCYPSILVSTDGTTWLRCTPPYDTCQLLGVAANDERFVVVGADRQRYTTAHSIIMTSTDATNWTVQAVYTNAGGLLDAACDGTVFVAVGEGGLIYSSHPARTNYVAPGGDNIAPYTNWNTAAHNLHEALNAAFPGGTILVSNGVYGLSDELTLSEPVRLQSVNGVDYTIIDGSNACCCVMLQVTNAIVDGFSLRNGRGGLAGGVVHIQTNGVVRNCRIYNGAAILGGGVVLDSGGMLYNCAIFSNNASFGSGIYCRYDGQAENCLVTRNTAQDTAGGVLFEQGGSLINCTIAGNQALNHSGGLCCIDTVTVANCIILDNIAPSNANHYEIGIGCSISYSCLEPIAGGTGNISEQPYFKNSDGLDYRLLYGSSCIDEGTGIDAPTNDIAGMARPVDGNFDLDADYDIGCFEYHPEISDSDSDTMPDSWEHHHTLNPTNAADATQDPDSDEAWNLHEYITDTDPHDSNAFLRVTNCLAGTSSWEISFPCAASRVYSLDQCTNPTCAWQPVTDQTNITGAAGGSLTLQGEDAPPHQSFRIRAALPQ